MNRKLCYAAVIAAVLPGCGAMHSMHSMDSGWTSVFDGKSLSGWNRVGDANWRIEDGVVVADKGRGFIVLPTQYKDFEMRVEFWADDEANSGVYYRCTSATDLATPIATRPTSTTSGRRLSAPARSSTWRRSSRGRSRPTAGTPITSR